MEIQCSKFVNAPIDVTFDIFSDITKTEARVDGITQVDILSDTKQGVGTRWRETRIMFGREATEEMEISDFKPNKSYDVVAESNGVSYHSRYTFTETNGGTQVDFVFSGKASSTVGKIMGFVFGNLFKGATKKAMEGDMNDLKAVAEAQAKAQAPA